jgi:hypothetical protein
MNPIPSIPKDLVEFLDTMFSAQAMLPRANDSERDVWMKVGKRELVTTLIQWRKDQETGADQGFPHVFVQSAVAERPDDLASAERSGTRPGPAGSYPSPADRLGRFSE